MRVLKKESQLDLHGVPSTAVDDLALAREALGVVFQELHDLRPNSLKDGQRMANIQKHLWATVELFDSGQGVHQPVMSIMIISSIQV